MFRVIFLLIAFCLCTAFGYAQNSFNATRNYTAVDGLPQSQVRTIVEDKSGYLWIGTDGGGLARFDGREFRVYTTLDGLLANQVIGLCFDRHDNLWILHPRGVTKFDGFHFKKFQGSASKSKFMGRRNMYLLQDTLFILTGEGLTGKIYRDSLYYWEKNIHGGRAVAASLVTSADQVYQYMSDGSIVLRDGRKTHSFNTGLSLGESINLFSYKEDVLIQSSTGIYKVDMKGRKLIQLPWRTTSYVLLYDQKENVFWTSNGNALLKETIRNNISRADTILHDTDVDQALIDSEGNTWFATNGGGLYKYFIQDFIRVSSDNLRGVMAIAKDRHGDTWVGTMNKGLWKISNGKLTSYVEEVAPIHNVIYCVAESPQGELYVGTSIGLGKYNKATDTFKWYTKSDGLPSNFAMNIAFDEHGMWIGTGNGLSYFDGSKFKNYSVDDGLAANGVWSLRYLKKYKTLFIGTEMAVNTMKDGHIGMLDIPEIMNTSVISFFTYQDSLLLVGTGGAGVVLVNPITGHRKLITTRDGLASDFAYFAVVDEQEYLWIGTEKGINRVRLDRNHDIAENLHFDHDNGLAGVETNQNAFYLSPGTKYFGLVDGLYEYNDLDRQEMRSFDIHLTDIKILYGEYSSREYADSTYGFFKIPYQPSLPPDRNHVTFQFNRVDKRYSQSVKYKYLLEHFDKTWSQPSSVNQVTYSNLPPGDYTFRAMSTNNRGSWSDTRIAYKFSVKAPFYQTASFLTGIFIFLGGLITLILYLRVQHRVNRLMVLERVRQREQELLRKEIARDFHDEMGNQLTRIINYVSLLKLNGSAHAGNTNDGNDVYGYVHGHTNGHDLYTKVEDSAKYLYSGTRDFIWSIDPVNDELSKLFIHIRDFGEKLFEEKGINFRAFNDVKEKIRLPYGFSRHANLIFKESMTNAFKSSEAKNVSLILRRDSGDGFEMSLEDDGIGFDLEAMQKSNGLQNIRERANRINTPLRIQSQRQQGTKIILNFSISKTIKNGTSF
ncbi:MAG: two-component regulator propeller domain-containing protein [Chryseolinea sp.]